MVYLSALFAPSLRPLRSKVLPREENKLWPRGRSARNLLRNKDFNSNSFNLKDLAGISSKSLIPKGRMERGPRKTGGKAENKTGEKTGEKAENKTAGRRKARLRLVSLDASQVSAQQFRSLQPRIRYRSKSRVFPQPAIARNPAKMRIAPPLVVKPGRGEQLWLGGT